MNNIPLKYIPHLICSALLGAMCSGIIVGVVLKHQSLTRETTTACVQATSPDGMYRCTVEEKSTATQSNVVITVYRRKIMVLSGTNLWEIIDNKEVRNDSASRSNYSIDWSLDKKNRTRGITVFGDFGSPPFPGEVLLQRTFRP